MPKSTKKPSKQTLLGRWRLKEMSNWDNDFMDEESPAFIEFKADGDGDFHFGYVHCGIDWLPERRGTMPAAEFTFYGNDEMEETHRRGWAAVQDDGSIAGHIYFHQGDNSSFRAEKR